jgi:hypothetical protein
MTLEEQKAELQSIENEYLKKIAEEINTLCIERGIRLFGVHQFIRPDQSQDYLECGWGIKRV